MVSGAPSQAQRAMSIFPEVICTGGIEGMAGSWLAMSQQVQLEPWALVESAGCLDAPQSLPAGSVQALVLSPGARPTRAQRFATRG